MVVLLFKPNPAHLHNSAELFPNEPQSSTEQLTASFIIAIILHKIALIEQTKMKGRHYPGLCSDEGPPLFALFRCTSEPFR